MAERCPESLMGAIMAFEGMAGSITAMNGPTGCKYYPASFSETVTRRGGFNPMLHDTLFYLGQSRVPCTYMDSSDYVSGARERMRALWDDSRSRRPSMLALINSPGASLIGEMLTFDGEAPPTVAMESPPPSASFSSGYETAMLATLEGLAPSPAEPREMTVNLLGISVADLGWEDSIADLRRLLSLCGVEVLCSPGAGWAPEDVQRSAGAALNVAVHDERAAMTSEWYRRNLNVPFVRCSSGAPLGFEALEEWLKEVCHALEADPSPALGRIAASRRRAHREISRLDQYAGLPRGCSFSLEGRPSLVWPALRSIHAYLGMVPVAVSMTEDGPCAAEVESYLRSIGCGEASTSVLDCPADVVLADGNTVAGVLGRGLSDCGVELDHPSLTPICIREDPLLGLGGTLRLIERSLQGLKR